MVLLAVDVSSASNGESTKRSETSKLPENALAGKTANSATEAKKEASRVAIQAIVNSSIYSLLGSAI